MGSKEIEEIAEVPRERRTEGECGKDKDFWFSKWVEGERVRDVHGEEIRQVKEFKYLDKVLCEEGRSSRE